MADADSWADRHVRPAPTATYWGPWMQATVPGGQMFVARTMETILGELVIHWTPEGLERFCTEGLLQARMAKAGIIPGPGIGFEPGEDGRPDG